MKWLGYIGLMVSLGFCTQSVLAGIEVGGTRVIYDGTQKEAELSVSNSDKTTPYLIQSWVEHFVGGSGERVPFLVTPPLFRLDAQQENMLRVVRVGGLLPEDRESVFYMNIKSIPATQESTTNQLQIAVKTQIKLFYRPAALKQLNAGEAYKQLTFSRRGGQLRVSNPTPFHVSFYSVKVGDAVIDQPTMVAPLSTQEWSLPASAGQVVTWQAITDFGGISPSVQGAL